MVRACCHTTDSALAAINKSVPSKVWHYQKTKISESCGLLSQYQITRLSTTERERYCRTQPHATNNSHSMSYKRLPGSAPQSAYQRTARCLAQNNLETAPLERSLKFHNPSKQGPGAASAAFGRGLVAEQTCTSGNCE